MATKSKQNSPADIDACRILFNALLRLKPGQGISFTGRVLHPSPFPTNEIDSLSGKITLKYEQRLNCNTEKYYEVSDNSRKNLSMIIISPYSSHIGLFLSQDRLTEPYVGIRESNSDALVRLLPSEIHDAVII